jgi:hypothetical protein
MAVGTTVMATTVMATTVMATTYARATTKVMGDVTTARPASAARNEHHRVPPAVPLVSGVAVSHLNGQNGKCSMHPMTPVPTLPGPRASSGIQETWNEL